MALGSLYQLVVSTGGISPSKSQPIQPDRDEMEGVTPNGVAMSTLVVNPAVSESPQTIHKQTKDKDAELNKGVELMGRYAKYAGDAPDGGLKAWSVVLGAALTICAALGYVTTWGIFQEYYQSNILKNESSSTIAWIGSVQNALIFFPGLITGRMFDIGHFKIPFLAASCLLVVCTFLIAECKEYWQFFLAQALGIGIACGVLFGPSLVVVSHWFKRRRGLAVGVATIGSSVGGVIFPVAAQNLIPEVGFKWTMRIIGFLLMFILVIANLILDRRLAPVKVKGSMFNFAAFKNPAYAVYCLSGIFTFLGLFTVITYVPLAATRVGISSNFAFYYVAIINGSAAFGRISTGFLGDKIGAINVMIPFTILSAAMTFVWPFVKTKEGLVAITVVYGFAYGTCISLLPIPVISMGPIQDVGRRTGLFFSFSALGALAGPPISGAINTATGGFVDMGWYGGAMLLFSAGLLALTRYLHLGKLTGKF